MRIQISSLAALFCLLPMLQAGTITNVNFSGILFGTLGQNQAFASRFDLTLSAPTNTFPATSQQTFSIGVPVTADMQFTSNGDQDKFTAQSLVIDSTAETVTGLSWYSGGSKVMGLISTIPSIVDYSFNQPFQNMTAFAFGGSTVPLTTSSGLLTITGTQYVGMNVTITPDIQAPEPSGGMLVLMGLVSLWGGFAVRRRMVTV